MIKSFATKVWLAKFCVSVALLSREVVVSGVAGLAAVTPGRTPVGAAGWTAPTGVIQLCSVAVSGGLLATTGHDEPGPAGDHQGGGQQPDG